MLSQHNEENIFERILSNIFPPELGTVDLEHTAEYHERMSRRGVENKPGYSHGRVSGVPRPKRVIHLSGRIA